MSNRFLFVLTLNISFLSTLYSFELKEAKETMETLLDFHVEYKELCDTLVKRTLKAYVEQFDREKTYLLQDEAHAFLSWDEKSIQQVTVRMEKGDFEPFYKLSEQFSKAIERSREVREEVYRELIIRNDLDNKDLGETFLTYPADEGSLEGRLKRKALRFLFAEAKLSGISQLNPSVKEKILTLLERKIQRQEHPYFFLDNQGKALSLSLKESYVATHFLKAFSGSLDAHTCYFSPEEAKELRALLEKQFEGVGIMLREGVNGIEITDLVNGGPAERSQKVDRGDLLIAIDDQITANMSYDEVLKNLNGDPGSSVKLTLQKKDGQESVALLKREKILLTQDRIQVSYEPCGDGIIGKIVLSSFYESEDGGSCENDLRKAIKELRKQGNLVGLILDLRSNSGGFLTQAVKVAGLFMKTGVVVISKYGKDKTNYLRDLDAKAYYDGPLLVLTSKASASAAEIVAQALQDYGTALIAGDERTYGKGTIQYQNVTDKSATSFFKVTVGKYYTVSGKSTQIEGVKADIVVPTANYNLNIGERFLDYSLPQDHVPSVYIDPLSDIEDSKRGWFNKYYLPHLQKKNLAWTPYLPVLSSNSAYRVAHNKEYQIFLDWYDRQKRKQERAYPQLETDFPMEEGVHIVQDMIYLKEEKAL